MSSGLLNWAHCIISDHITSVLTITSDHISSSHQYCPSITSYRSNMLSHYITSHHHINHRLHHINHVNLIINQLHTINQITNHISHITTIVSHNQTNNILLTAWHTSQHISQIASITSYQINHMNQIISLTAYSHATSMTNRFLKNSFFSFFEQAHTDNALLMQDVTSHNQWMQFQGHSCIFTSKMSVEISVALE